MEITKKIRNTLDVPQQIIYRGQQEVLGPNEEQTFELALANEFLKKCAPVVQEVEEKVLSFEGCPNLSGKTMWLANMTGDTGRFKKTLVVNEHVRKDGRWTREDVEKADIRYKAFAVVRDWDPGQVTYKGRYGLEGKNLAPIPIKVGVRQRIEVPVEVGEWFLRRDSQGATLGNPFNKCVIRSRAPSAFEPDMSWELEDIRCYMRLISAGKGDDGPTQNKVIADVKRGKHDGHMLARALREAKQDLLANVFYYVADPRYRLPTKEEFLEFKHGKPADEVEAELAMALASKQAAGVAPNAGA